MVLMEGGRFAVDQVMHVVRKYLFISDGAGRMPGGAAQSRRPISHLDSRYNN